MINLKANTSLNSIKIIIELMNFFFFFFLCGIPIAGVLFSGHLAKSLYSSSFIIYYNTFSVDGATLEEDSFERPLASSQSLLSFLFGSPAFPVSLSKSPFSIDVVSAKENDHSI